MLKMSFVKIISIFSVMIFLSGCVTSTHMKVLAMNPNGVLVDDATVMVNGEVIGQTPNAGTKVSNFAGKDVDIIVSKDGYNTTRTEAEKEVKAPNVVFGILLNFFAWLWVYGPKEQQIVELSALEVE